MKKKEVLLFQQLEDLEDIMQSEISQAEEDKYCMISFIYGIEKHNKWTNKTKQNIDRENRLLVVRGEGGWGLGEMDKGGNCGGRQEMVMGSN